MAFGASLGTAVLHLVTNASGLILGMGKAEGVVRAKTASMAALGGRLTKGLTLPIIAGGIAVGKMAIDFEHSLSRVTGLVGISQEQVNEWGQDILKLAPEIGKSPRELGDALFFATSAGARGAEVLNLLRLGGKASAAGLGETKTVIDTVTSATNAYGLETLTSARATDILTAAVREGKMEPQELAGVMGRLLPTAAAMNISFENVAGTMAVLSRTGLGTAEAATSVQAVMTTMLKPTQGARKALAGVGLEFQDLRKVASGPDGIVGVLRLLEDRFEGNDEALAEVIPNVRAFRGAMSVLAQDGSIVDDVMEGVRDSTGALDHAFAEASDTVRHKWNVALAELQSTAITIGTILLPIFARIFQFVGKVAGAFTRLPEPVQLGIVAFLGMAAAAGPLIFLITAMLNPIGLTIAALVGLAIGLKMAWDHSETFQAIVNAVFSWLAAYVPKVVDAVAKAVIAAFNWMRNTFGPVADFFVNQGRRIADFTRQHWDSIQQTVSNVVGFIRDLITTVWPFIRSLITTQWNLIRNITETVWNAIKILIETAIGIIENVIKIAMGIITGDWSLAWEGMKGLVSTVLNGVVALVSTILTGLASTALTLATDIANSIWEGINSVIGLIGQLGGTLLGAIGGAVGAAAAGAFSMAVGIGRAIVNGALSGVGSLGGALRGAVQGAVSSALSSINPFSPVEHGAELFIGDPIIEGAVDTITRRSPEIRAALERGLGNIMPNVSLPSVSGTRGSGAGTGAGTFGKLAETVNFFDKQDSEAIIADLGNRVALRMGALA